MFALICGGGKVGYYLAKSLLVQNLECVLLEKDASRSHMLSGELGDAVIAGDACDPRVLANAGIANPGFGGGRPSGPAPAQRSPMQKIPSVAALAVSAGVHSHNRRCHRRWSRRVHVHAAKIRERRACPRQCV